MKPIIKNVVAAISVTALLSSAIGLSSYSFSKSLNNFKGVYSLFALAEESSYEQVTQVTVADRQVDATSIKSLVSTNNDYVLYLTAVDLDDLGGLAEIKVGYNLGGLKYNGKREGLSNVVYSSLTSNGVTINATDIYLPESFKNPWFVITEVEISKSSAEHSLAIEGATPWVLASIPTTSKTGTAKRIATGDLATTLELPVLNQSDYTLQNRVYVYNADTSITVLPTISTQMIEGEVDSFFTISGSYSTSKGSVTYNDVTYDSCLQMERGTSVQFTLPKSATVTFVFDGCYSSAKINGTEYSTGENGIIKMDLAEGYYELTQRDKINLFYIEISEILSTI